MESERMILSYVCDNCGHHWTGTGDSMIEEDSCPCCTVVAMPDVAEPIDLRS
jgi:hypothetical protein